MDYTIVLDFLRNKINNNIVWEDYLNKFTLYLDMFDDYLNGKLTAENNIKIEKFIKRVKLL